MKLTVERDVRSAGFQPAVSQGFQPASQADYLTRSKMRTVCRLEIGDTAGWKPALPRLRLRRAASFAPLRSRTEQPQAIRERRDGDIAPYPAVRWQALLTSDFRSEPPHVGCYN